MGMFSLHAQNDIVSSGGDATGIGGTVSYSVGQEFYSTSTNTSGSVAQGVQQAIEIQVVLGIEAHEINLNAKVYPNPTNELIHLSVGNTETSDLSYQLYDLSGRILSTAKIESEDTSIVMSRYPESTYLLSVTKGNKTIKTFKIIKN